MDVNRDGLVNMADVSRSLQILLGYARFLRWINYVDVSALHVILVDRIGC